MVNHEFADTLKSWALLVALWISMALILPAGAQTGTWTATSSAPDSLETALLLTDGTILVHSYGTYTSWFKLTPDAQGNYADGVWTQVASNAEGRLYGQTAVLRDGRVFNGGGEYLSGSATDHNTCEVYDPVTNQWLAAPDSLNDSLGDTGSAILPDGRLLCSNWGNNNTDIYNPTTNSWANAAPMASNTGDEEGFLALPDGSILNAYVIGQRYLPSQNTWLATAPIPVSLVDTASEIGPALLLYDGRALVLGATGHNAFYTPPTTLTGSGSWTAGPDMPGGLSAPDTAACVEVNGKVLCVGTPTDFAATSFLEFDPTTNVFTPVASPAGFNQSSDATRMLALPNGQVLLTAGYQNAWVYTPVGGPKTAWAPRVASVTANGGGTYTVAGTQLNGLTNGGAYGDEANPYTHYPIVSLVDSSGNVHFARTFNFSQMNPSALGGQQSAQFTLPGGLPNGAYSLHVIASGISSVAFPYNVISLPAGPYRITPQNRPDLALDVAGFGNADNTTVDLWYANYGIGQQWLLAQQTDGSYIINAFAGKNTTQVLDDTSGLTANGSLVRTYHNNGLTPQRWNIAANGGGWYRIIPINAPGQTLDMSGGPSAGPGAAANLYQFTGTGNQLFRFDSATPPILQVSTVAVSAITASSATVTWTTNITANDAVDYGSTSAYGSTTTGTGNAGSTDNHSVALSGLTPGAVYHYRVRSNDYSGQTATSTDATFTVLQSPSGLAVGNVSGLMGQTALLSATLTNGSGPGVSGPGVSGPGVSGKSVSFLVDGNFVGTGVTGANGVATFSYSISVGSALGSHTIMAGFSGDSGYRGSTGTGTLTVLVATVLTVPSASIAHGGIRKILASLNQVVSGAGVRGEPLTFLLDGTAVTTIRTTASGGVSVPYVIPSTTTVGNHTISFWFAGDSTYAAAQGSATLTVY